MASGKDIQQWQVTEPYLDLHCRLGEGPFYEAATNSLRFVDILNKRVHFVDLAKGPESLTTLQLDTRVTVTADIEGVNPQEKILVGAKYGMAVLDRKAGTLEYVTRFAADQDNERLRSNDGAIDPHGRFWLGSMTDFELGPFQAEGSVFLFDGKKPAQSMRSPVTIPNSICWSPDGKTMYFTHSSARTVFAWDYSPVDGSLSNERVFYQHEGPGEPDGARIDVDGNMWHAVYGESCVLKLSPQGELLGKVMLPTKNITCPQFVGTELFITTAGMEEGDGTPEQVALSGAVFRVDVGTRGLPPVEFKMGTA